MPSYLNHTFKYEGFWLISRVMMQETDFYLQGQHFLESLFQEMKEAGIKLESHWDIDHLCYRSDSQENYQELKCSFEAFGRLLIESVVNGRLISTFKLFRPIECQGWRIDLIELPAPKAGKIVQAGFEHIEIVCDVPFSEIIEKYSHLTMDEKGLNKDYNQELEICLGARNLKFHHSSLASVINLELKAKVWQAIGESKVLKHLKELKPLIAGTFPLAVDIATSDVDVLVETKHLHELDVLLRHHYGQCEGFAVSLNEMDLLPTLVCKFIFNQVPFEIFAQDRPAIKQTAYRHFLIEERLLKFGGDAFYQKVLQARAFGLKTELAFGEVLNLDSDPYIALLNLQKLPSGSIQFV
jgi:predicted metalloenzyme YecM